MSNKKRAVLTHGSSFYGGIRYGELDVIASVLDEDKDELD